MADFLSKEKRSKLMASIKSKGNADTEMRLISIFKANKIRGWRRNLPIHGKPDFVFRKCRVAVFVDGCFWHGCPKHGRYPQTNEAFWLGKLRRNKLRDRKVTSELRRRGWLVIRIWEHSLKHQERIVLRINRQLIKAGHGSS